MTSHNNGRRVDSAAIAHQLRSSVEPHRLRETADLNLTSAVDQVAAWWDRHQDPGSIPDQRWDHGPHLIDGAWIDHHDGTYWASVAGAQWHSDDYAAGTNSHWWVTRDDAGTWTLD